MSKKEPNNSNKGLLILFICGIIAIALIIACVFFQEQFFELLKK